MPKIFQIVHYFVKFVIILFDFFVFTDNPWNTEIIPEYNVEERFSPTLFSFYSKKLKGEILCLTGCGEKSNTVEILNLKNFPKMSNFANSKNSRSDSHDSEMQWILVKDFTFPMEYLWSYRSISLNG